MVRITNSPSSGILVNHAAHGANEFIRAGFRNAQNSSGASDLHRPAVIDSDRVRHELILFPGGGSHTGEMRRGGDIAKDGPPAQPHQLHPKGAPVPSQFTLCESDGGGDDFAAA